MDEEKPPVIFNDVDFCLRLKECGYTNVHTPYAALQHHEPFSRGGWKTSPEPAELKRQANVLRERWAHFIEEVPAYSPCLSLGGLDYQLAWPPRRTRPWKDVL